MKNLLLMILKVIGWQNLLLSVWDMIDDDLKKHAAKSETQVDDNAVKVLDGMIRKICAENV